ncbi:MAG: hypothetical protein ACRCX8_21280, partial [Sarcina sp.]
AILINGNVFIKPLNVKKEVDSQKDEVKSSFFVPEEPNTEIPTIAYTISGNALYADNIGSEEQEVSLEVKTYFKEAYPDFNENEMVTKIKIPIGKSKIFESVKNKITTVEISKELFVLEYKPSFYFTTVKSLKEAFVDTGLKLPTKTDDQYKDKIIEKSLYLKKKFGLTESQTENHEMYPSFKRLTTLYCLQDLVAFTFISGEAESGGGDTPTSSSSLSLGKFSTKDSSGNSDSKTSTGFLPEVLAEQISIAEADVRASIFIESDKVYWYKKTGGGK